MERLTVFTPTYNRRNTIGRVYNSLCRQTYKDFRWLIIDDGSTDDTDALISEYKKHAPFPITYVYQKNTGKHIATNRAVEMTNSELFIIADSDDAFVDNAFETLVSIWDGIENQDEFKGVNCRVFDHDSGLGVGPEFPAELFDSTDEEAYFHLKLHSEKWNLFKTEALREFPFPEIKNAHFFPETVIWQRMARKYKTRFTNQCLREYFRDAANSVTKGEESVRYNENIHLWTHFINAEFKYFGYYPKRFIQSFIGLVRDGKLIGYSDKEILSIPNTLYKRALCLLFYPIGIVLYKMKK